VPLHHLRGMPQQDLYLYQNYTARRRFPSRRIELLLAQVSMVLAQVHGNKARLSDWLFDEVHSEAAGELGVDDFLDDD
jgi:hypothetical protein